MLSLKLRALAYQDNTSHDNLCITEDIKGSKLQVTMCCTQREGAKHLFLESHLFSSQQRRKISCFSTSPPPVGSPGLTRWTPTGDPASHHWLTFPYNQEAPPNSHTQKPPSAHPEIYPLLPSLEDKRGLFTQTPSPQTQSPTKEHFLNS